MDLITCFDALLIASTKPFWQTAARAVGEAMAWSPGEEGAYRAGDLVLFGRAQALAEQGALEWRGDLSFIQACEFRLPSTI